MQAVLILTKLRSRLRRRYTVLKKMYKDTLGYRLIYKTIKSVRFISFLFACCVCCVVIFFQNWLFEKKNQEYHQFQTVKDRSTSGPTASCLGLGPNCLQGAQWLSGRVLDSRPRAAGSSLTSDTVLCHWARHIYPCSLLVQPRKTRPDITAKIVDWDVKDQIKQTKQTVC